MPRISRQAKELNRRKILEAASVMFRERGVDQVGIDQLMQEAGLTRGGFYNHFASKEEVIAEACRAAFSGAHERLGHFLNARVDDPAPSGVADTVSQSSVNATPPGPEALLAVALEYLSSSHRDSPGNGCPTASLGVDISRHGADAQQQYAEGIRRYLEVFAELMGHDTECESSASTSATGEVETRAVELLSSMVGAMVLARAVKEGDPGLSEEILRVARATAASTTRARFG